MNTPVNFETAKQLKINGYKVITANYYFEDGEYRENELEDTYNEGYSFSQCDLMENWNSEWISKKDGSRSFGGSKSNGYLETYSAPTIAEVVMWLYKKHSFWISVVMTYPNKWEYDIQKIHHLSQLAEIHSQLDSPTEAYSKAIYYTLTKLI